MSSDHKFKPTPERRGPAIYYDELGLEDLKVSQIKPSHRFQ